MLLRRRLHHSHAPLPKRLSAEGTAVAIRSLSHHFTSPRDEQKAADTALRVLDLIATEPSNSHRSASSAHARVIQSCLRSALSRPLDERRRQSRSPPSSSGGKNESFPQRTSFLEEDPIVLFLELHRRGLPLDAATASGALSFLGGNGDLQTGLQLHSMSLKTGVDGSTAVSSALVSLYSKCGRLVHALKVFDEMCLRDTVLYTSMIAGFAQHSEVAPCLLLFNEMRRSEFVPNDFTLASVLSACTEAGWLGLGRSFHCLGSQMGFDKYRHVCNALISMYAKCGSIGEAAVMFERMESKDLISWNAMISGFAQYGLMERTLNLLEEMIETKAARPDEITFLGVLSSCRHAGFVEQGYRCFQLMIDHGVKPCIDHYSCVVDLLARAGLLERALNFIQTMPLRPNGVIWGSLLSACKVHGNVKMGLLAAQSRLLLEPACAATHLQLANMYAAIGWWIGVADVRKLMKDNGLKTSPGFSWIEVGNEVHRFKAEAKTVNEVNREVYILEILEEHMKGL